MARLVVVLLTALWTVTALALTGGGFPDPFMLNEVPLLGGAWNFNHGYNDVNFIPRTLRASQTVDTSKKTLVLIVAGQSNYVAEAPTAYAVTNTGAIDNFSIYDGGLYAFQDPPLGSTWQYTTLNAGTGGTCTPTACTCATVLSCGSIAGRIADSIINNGAFEHVVVVPVAVAGTEIGYWAGGGSLNNRMCVAMMRLAQKGITPSTPNTSFAVSWGQGESDGNPMSGGMGTSEMSYVVGLGQIKTSITIGCAAPFSGRFFVNVQTYFGTRVWQPVQCAQGLGVASGCPDNGAIDNTFFFSGPNLDTLTGSMRQFDNTHFSDAGLAQAAAMVETAMHASGPPF